MDGRDSLDADFPVGDGTADTAASVLCPCCGESCELVLDPGGGARQDYVEDCPVCCRPWRVHLRYTRDGAALVEIEAED